jgi:hypothetical protein
MATKKDIATHLSHCNQGENEGTCKYGEADCPALMVGNPQAIATGIVRMAEAAHAMMNSGLSERALIVLVNDMTGVTMRDIKQVLKALSNLTTYVEADKFYNIKRR